MAWDTEGTRRRLNEAATVEFAERGRDGTTMARIAERAGINKERLYKYFGDKQALFETVLRDELEKVAAAVAPPPAGLADIGEFAARTFDYYAAHPELARLLQWEGLAGGPAADELNRTAHYQETVQAFAAAQRSGVLDDDLDPARLVFLIIALAAWWFSVPQVARMLTGADAGDPAEHGRRRACVVRAAQRLALPGRHRQVMPDDVRGNLTDGDGAMSSVTERSVIAACSFCQKPNTEVATLVAGPGVFICGSCVALCAQVIEGKPASVRQLAPWEQEVSADEVLANLPRVAAAGTQVEQSLAGWVRRARALGATWARIGDALGMTRQSAWERFSGQEQPRTTDCTPRLTTPAAV